MESVTIHCNIAFGDSLTLEISVGRILGGITLERREGLPHRGMRDYLGE